MQDIDLYGERYFATSCGPLPYERSEHWLSFFGQIAEHLIRALRPSRVFDAGCALGFLVESFWDRGIYSEGVDISEYAISQVRRDMARYCKVQSLTEPISSRFDLITCIEVLEHIDPNDTTTVIQNLCAATDTILFSSSPSDFSEPTHINVQPPKYWLDAFADQGFGPDSDFDAGFLTPHAFLVRKGFSADERIRRLFSEHLRLKSLLQEATSTKTEHPITVQVFPFDIQGYSEAGAVTSATSSGTWNTLCFSLRASDAAPIRIDPSGEESIVYVKRIAVLDESSKQVLWNADDPTGFDTVHVTGTAKRLLSDSSVLGIVSYGRDPQLILPDFHTDVASIVVEISLRIETAREAIAQELLKHCDMAQQFETHLRDLRRNRELDQRHEQSIDELRQQHERSIDELRQQHERSIDELRQQHERSINELKQQLAAAELALERANQNCRKRVEQLDQTRTALRSMSQTSAEGRYELEIARARIIELENQIGSLHREQAEMTALRDQLADCRKTLYDVLTSLSWKVTQPGRAVMALVRGGARRSTYKSGLQ